MRKLYFNLDNGSVVEPRDITAPAYYVVIDDWSQIQEIYTCFSCDRIKMSGLEWMYSMLYKDCFEWVNYSHLMQSLKKYIIGHVNTKHQFEYDELYADQYVYQRFWQSHK